MLERWIQKYFHDVKFLNIFFSTIVSINNSRFYISDQLVKCRVNFLHKIGEMIEIKVNCRVSSSDGQMKTPISHDVAD